MQEKLTQAKEMLDYLKYQIQTITLAITKWPFTMKVNTTT
jgi:hypothetical protein